LGTRRWEMEIFLHALAGERVHDAGGCEAVSGVAGGIRSLGRTGCLLRCRGGDSAVWREGLGGKRTAKKDSVIGLEERELSGYADYMQTTAFDSEVDWLMKACGPSTLRW